MFPKDWIETHGEKSSSEVYWASLVVLLLRFFSFFRSSLFGVCYFLSLSIFASGMVIRPRFVREWISCFLVWRKGREASMRENRTLIGQENSRVMWYSLYEFQPTRAAMFVKQYCSFLFHSSLLISCYVEKEFFFVTYSSVLFFRKQIQIWIDAWVSFLICIRSFLFFQSTMMKPLEQWILL